MNERLTESFFDLILDVPGYNTETDVINNDFKSINNAFLYFGSTTNYQSDLFNFTDLENLDFSMLCPVKNVKKRQIFSIIKIHRKKCSHKKVSRIERNKIKKLVEEDLANLINKNNFQKRFKFLEKSFEKVKECKNKKRLYDEDVIVKKIMSNFNKFLRLLLFPFINNTNSEIITKKFFNVLSCKEFLSQIEVKQLIKANEVKNISKTLLSLNLSFIFEFFIESNYFHNYLLEKLKKNFEDGYVNSFIAYTLKIKNK
jgi:hypothetical protein